MPVRAERVEITFLGPSSVEDQLKALSPEKLEEEIRKINGRLGEFHVRIPVANIADGAYTNGYRYEDKRFPSGAIRATAMNWFMSLIHQQPGLRKLSQEKFEELGQLVSELSIATDELLKKKGGRYEWPKDLQEPPKTP